MTVRNTYHNYKIEVKVVVPGSLSSFIYAYCKTLNCAETSERYFIRKAISFAKLSKYVRQYITNDFDRWYRENEDGVKLMEVLSNLINEAEGRTLVFKQTNAQRKLVSKPFYISGFNLPMVLVQH